ncbi:Phosphatidylserine/phosphatidylglycerophosphate/cardiolipin synthase [Jatrophihabitans endophyticus]|uniref:Phosphatidylserine/phosphatidylglycerophosphate/cardiolipin synthase n=1 Tax=Jatrophihabitans endophyticus TaxID=1206085 RepID=A0A1M5P9R9_9ACTN|nr:phospholipase D-like domain-containing protein [Jatrophihabitans endophyticus]SHG97983.1 Phosphatidylserine/phosphatidylglycerophosphate/cardiolipin synthase [Jatrophihabitans endophyticus]
MPEYFPAPSADCPTFDGDTEWAPIVDGVAYFAELDEVLTGLERGDEVLIAGLELDADLDLTGRPHGADGRTTLVDRLVAAGAAGVDVRILLAGKLSAFVLPLPGLANFRANAALCHRVNGSPGLAGHALVDYSGPLLGSNHQKTVVVTRRGEVTAFVGGIDLVQERFDHEPHTTLRLKGDRWGWHDTAVRLRGPAAARAHDVFLRRWHEAAGLPTRAWVRRSVNPPAAPTPAAAGDQKPVAADHTSVRVLRSISNRKLDSVLPWRRVRWDALPPTGVQEIFETLTAAIAAARRYVYIEDQYLAEYTAGAQRRFELYPYLRDAAARGVKVVLVGSGTRDPDDPGLNLRPINSSVNRDIRSKILRRLDPERRGNVAVYRVEHVTMHSKLTLIDDVFANIGSANLFSRSMSGVDAEISAAVETSTPAVRDLRVRVWAEHLRAPLSAELAAELGDLDLALGIWDPAWLPADRPATTWRTTGEPASFAPVETVLRRVDTR